MEKNLFISKNESEILQFSNFLRDKGIRVLAHSFLHFEQVEFEIQSHYDILFFSSPRSIVFFKTRSSVPSHVKIACTGSKTAELLEQMGHEVSFTRKENESLTDFAASFKNWCGERHVLFPISSISLKTISSQFPENQKTEMVAYSTLIKGKDIEDCSTYVFTSPSNVEGFFTSNQIPQTARIISWGESTSKALLKKGCTVELELKSSSVEELIEVVL